jgi:hypothetical protein
MVEPRKDVGLGVGKNGRELIDRQMDPIDSGFAATQEQNVR